jgi:PAT family beta-lactamase induction signal transducer AmpG
LHVLIGVICTENFFVGMESTAFVAFLMGLCNHRYTAMQFALLSALATLGRIFAGPIGALIVDYGSWTYFYWVSFLIAMPALWLLWYQQHSLGKASEFRQPSILNLDS